MSGDIAASCECGFTATSSIGSGSRNCETLFHFPALCRACNGLVTVNLGEDPPACPKCRSTDVVPYDQPGLVPAGGATRVAEWKDRSLTDGQYFCPGCGQFTLTFSRARDD